MNEVHHDQIVAAIARATHDVFSTMLDLPVEPQNTRRATRESSSFDGIIALVGVGGSWTGSGRIYCSPGFACRMAGALVGSELNAVNEEVLDAVAEVANMIVGNIKTVFEEQLGPLGLSVPTVIFGRNYHTRTSGVRDWSVVPFRCEGQTMEVWFCLMPSRPSTHSSTPPRVEIIPV
jgi:chemotaxis protein CheX